MKTAERFIKKQVTVEAIQFNGNSNRAGIELFVGKELKTELESETAYIAGHGAPIFSLLIETKEGVMKAFKNDWIIKEPFPTGDRDFYPCKSDIFEKTYSPLASHPSPMSAADMTAREYFDGEGSPLTLSKICNDEEKEFLLQHIELYASGKVHQSKQPPMSAEQVELLESSKIALHTLDCIEFTREQGTASKRLETAISNFSTTPSVKADGWVSVEDGLPEIPPPYYDKDNEVHKPIQGEVWCFDGSEVYEDWFYFNSKPVGCTHWKYKEAIPSPPKQK